MYLPYWGMTHQPFAGANSPASFVPLESALLVLTKLRYVIGAELGSVLLTGPGGCGKSGLARLVMDEFAAAGWATAYLANPSGEPGEVLGLLAFLLGAPADGGLTALLRRLDELCAAGRRVCVVFDDLHTVQDRELLENLRMLLNVEAGGRKAVNLLLVGQPEAEAKLRRASNFLGHISLRVRMQAFDEEDAKKYVLYRLKVAGCSRGIFTRSAAEEIYRLSGGLPRHINRLCELALLVGCGLSVKKIGPEVIQTAAADLGLEPGGEPAKEKETSSLTGGEEEDGIDILAELAPNRPGEKR